MSLKKIVLSAAVIAVHAVASTRADSIYDIIANKTIFATLGELDTLSLVSRRLSRLAYFLTTLRSMLRRNIPLPPICQRQLLNYERCLNEGGG